MSRAKALIRASYDRSAADFSEYADRLVYRFLAAPLAERLRGVSGPVLDVASGTGALARLLEHAIAVDISREQLIHNEVGPKAVADAETLPFRRDAFAAAASAFGINHFPDAEAAVSEMARVAPLVGVVTWARPEVPFEPKEIVLEAVRRHAGRSRTEAGDYVDDMTNATGSVDAIAGLLEQAGLTPEVDEVAVDVPWPGTDRFVDYRMAMTGVIALVDEPEKVRAEAVAVIDSLPGEALLWAPRLVLGMGGRARSA